MKTPMQELIKEVRELQLNARHIPEKVIDELLEKEKQMVIEAYNDGKFYGSGTGNIEKLEDTGEHYYNETFKK
jgi:regulator of replication initiation timing